MNRRTFFLSAVFALCGCASNNPDGGSPPFFQISEAQTGAYGTRPAFADVRGELGVLYSTKEGRVALKVGGQPEQLIDATARVKSGGSFFQLWSGENVLYAGWWSHQSGKNIYFTSSRDGGKTFANVSMVNDANDVLPPFTLTKGPQGVLGMTYQDERAPKFQAYFNRSLDGGLSWQRPDLRLDTPPAGGKSSDVHEPQTVVSGTSWISAWTDNTYTDGRVLYRIVSRRTDDAGETWSLPTVLHQSDHHFSSLIVRASGDSVVLAADELNKGVFALTSTDNGRNWRNSNALAGTAGLSNSGIAMSIADKRAHLVWMEQRNDEKLKIAAASLDVATARWAGDLKRLDSKTHDNTKSTSPTIMATERGALVVAWVDYRDIRPNIYFSTSYDQGAAWSTPQALLNPGEVSAGWPQLINVNGKTLLAYETYPNERVADGVLNVQTLPVDDGAAAMSRYSTFAQYNDTQKLEKLKQRIDSLWATRVAGNYAAAYDMFDFAYKAVTPKKQYVDNAGVISYLSFAVGDIKVVGNVASVDMKLKYEMKPTIMPSTGKPISVPPIEVDSPTRWVWVWNNWYLVYTPSFEPPVLSY